ncbi:low specificity L-threonine aldolase [Microlunatus sp. Gsoil 973]|uniref:threonine aldolase family protein n=1 Tax=Microlunatus sp. Gsoil 973 TaxID=2672569 RepID=UPI001E2C23A7|nr:GntG family PLP-dependent aldolase [Microlunatus sp. Gsoil 973]
MTVIDLRSDTLTRPTPGMLEAMTTAPVGDDVYDEDPTVHELESRVAELFGHEDALFCVTGSLSNQLGIRMLVEPGEEVLCDAQAHIVRAEMGSHAAVGQVTTRTFSSSSGLAEADRIAEMISVGGGPYHVTTAAVAIENTLNYAGGRIQPYENLVEISELCQRYGIKRHLDGARLWNAYIATGAPLVSYGALYDTISVCFSKGLGAPIGSVLVSSAENIARARILRKRMGAGWRQAGLLASAALYALEHQLTRLADDHAAARAFAEEVAAAAPAAIRPEDVETNIVVLDTGDRDAGKIVDAAAREDVRVSRLGPHTLRAVTHLDVDENGCRTAGKVLGSLLA